MMKYRLGVLFLGMVLLAGGTTMGQEKSDEVPPPKPGKLKGFLPMNWAKLGLTEEQKQKVYGIQGKYRDEIGKLEEKIKELKVAEKKELESVLTEAQKARLREIVNEKLPKVSEK